MKARIIGIENQNYKIDNEEIIGQKLHYTYENKNIIGLGVGSIFERNGDRKLNEEIELKWSTSFKKFYISK